jgi:TPR repeat protein
MKTLLITLFVGLMSNTIAGAGTAADIPPELARLIEIERVKAKTISGADYQSGKEPTDYTLKQAEDLIRSGGAKKVISYLEKLGASGNPAGWRLLTKIYQEDESGLRNNELAYRYAIKGVEAGDVDSHRALGWILLGAGPHKNPKLAAVVWERAVALGNCVSASNLGVLYKSGGAGNSPAQIVPINFELARKWFQRSISCGNPVASKWMGDLYQHGLGVEANQETATSYYMQAALQGVPEAQYLIGQRYQSGIAVQKDVSLARHWYERALESGKTFNDGNTFFKPQLAETAISLLERQSNALENVPTAIARAEEATLASRGDSNALLKVTPKPQAADLQPRANRKALIFGNDAYASAPKLENAKYDALAIAAGLRRVGYQVFLETDATRSKMNAAIRKFKSTIEGGDEVAIFYAGHAVQIANTNYLLPIDLKADSEDQIKDDAVPLQRLLDDVADRNAKFTLAIIDACRDNPFKSKNGRSIGGTRGLSPTTAATGQMIVFSAGSGQQALDKLGPDDKLKNGLFTRTFLKHIDTPGVSIDQIVRDVREEVVKSARSVGHEQVPAIYDQVIGRFYFRN